MRDRRKLKSVKFGLDVKKEAKQPWKKIYERLGLEGEEGKSGFDKVWKREREGEFNEAVWGSEVVEIGSIRRS